MQVLAVEQSDQRQTSRYQREGRVVCQYGAEESTAATLQNVSVDGVSVRLEKHIPEGSNVLLKCGSFLPELKCKVLWCRSVDYDWCFTAGLHIYHTDADVAAGVTALVLSAQLYNQN